MTRTGASHYPKPSYPVLPSAFAATRGLHCAPQTEAVAEHVQIYSDVSTTRSALLASRDSM